jgi:hypothetical protein
MSPGARQLAATLIEALLDERLSARQVINQWPVYNNTSDRSLMLALKMVWYFEADELMHKTELFYADLQLTLLAEVARCFKNEQPLPFHILNAYQIQKEPMYFYNQQTFWNSCFMEIQKALGNLKTLVWQLCYCWPNSHKLPVRNCQSVVSIPNRNQSFKTLLWGNLSRKEK